MSKEDLEKRIAELRKSLEQIQANGNATLGAIAECEYWLRKIDKSGEGKTPSPNEEA